MLITFSARERIFSTFHYKILKMTSILLHSLKELFNPARVRGLYQEKAILLSEVAWISAS
jgi:hypothetical protein